MGAGPRFNSFGLALLLAAIAVGSAPWALAEIRATGKNGLKTMVNGRSGGRCNDGICRIGGGTNAGKNKFHRFQEFDTRGAIKRVEFDTGGKRNLILGVTSSKGSWINKALSLSSKANLFFLSPGGLYVGKGAEFINVPKLTLSTADQLKFSEGVFDVVSTTRSSVQDFRTNPLPGVFGMPLSEIEEPVVLAAGELPGIHLDGINVSLAEELLVNAPGGRVNVTASRLAVGSDEITGRIALTGIAVNVDSDSVLIAKGKSGGGLIEVIESRQNRYESVRQEFIGAEDYVINTAAEGSGPDTAADVSGPDTAADVSGPDTAADVSGPDTAADVSGPDTAADVSGPDTAADVSGPDTAADVSGPDTAADVSGPDTAADVSGPDTAADVSGPDTAADVSGPDTAADVSGPDTADEGEGREKGGSDEDQADGEEGGDDDGTAASPEPTPEEEGPPKGVARGVENVLPPGEKGNARELVDSILLVQVPPDQAPMIIALSTPMEPMAAGPAGSMAAGPMGPMAAGPMGPMAAGPMGPMAAGPMEPMAAGPMDLMAAGPMEPIALGPMEPMAAGPAGSMAPVAPESAQYLGDGAIGDGGFGGNGLGPGVEGGGEVAPELGPDGQGERADGEGPPEDGGPEGDRDGPGGNPAGGDGEPNTEMGGADPAALMPQGLSGEGYEVSLSLESSFQMSDAGNPSIGAPSGGTPVVGSPDGVGGAAVGDASSQLNAATSAVGEGATAAISGGSEGTAPSGAGSPEGGVPAASSGSEGDGASATATPVGEEGAIGEAGGEESSGAEVSGIETVDVGEGEEGGDEGSAAAVADGAEGADGSSEGDATAASAETEEGETVEGDAVGDEAAREEGVVGGNEGPSGKPKAPSAAVAVQRVNAKRASENLASGDAKATSQTLQGLDLPDLSTRRTPTPGAIANSLRQARQWIKSGAGQW